MGTVTVRKADDDTFEIEWENGETSTASTSEEAAIAAGVPLNIFMQEFDALEKDEDTVDFEVEDEEPEEEEEEEKDG